MKRLTRGRSSHTFTKAVDRPIATEDANGNPTTHRVHESVLTCWDRDPTYRPTNVRDRLTRRADPRAERC